MNEPWISVEALEGDCRIVSLSGEAALTGGRLHRDLTATLSNDHGGVVVDCSGLEFLDRRTIDSLLAASAELGERLVVVAPPGDVRDVLEIAELDTFLRIVRSREEALAALGVAG
ncbi:MAG TPA: STAS domain-containing protein [Gaiellaceae bacterium]|nr:STAS domain-containing protein [Gaiellaceae bacterium]